MVFTGQGILQGRFTTAGGFLAMGFTNFKGIQEMGIICGGGLLVCLIPMMTMLPVLLLRGRQNVVDHEQGELRREAGADREPLAAAAGAGRRASRWRCARWRRRRSARSISITTCSTCRARGCRRWNLRRTSSNSTPKSVLFGAVIATNLQQAVDAGAAAYQPPGGFQRGIPGQPFLSEDQTRKLARGRHQAGAGSVRFRARPHARSTGRN